MNEIRFEDYEKFTHKIAHRLHTHMRKLGVAVEYMDVFQECSVSFVKASRGFDQSRGFQFTTYYSRVAYREFLRQYKAEITERTEAFHISLDSPSASDEDRDHHDVIADETLESADERIIRLQRMEHNFSRLSKLAQVVIAQVINPSAQIRECFDRRVSFVNAAREVGISGKHYSDYTISFVCSALGLDRNVTARIKREIVSKCQTAA